MEFIDEKFWVAVSFVIFIALFYKKASNFITTTLDQRSSEIKNNLQSAYNLAKEAKDNLSIQKNRLEQIKSEINDIFDRTKNQVASLEESAKSNLESLILIREEVVTKKIIQQEKLMKEELLKEAVDQVFETVILSLENGNYTNFTNSIKLHLDQDLIKLTT